MNYPPSICPQCSEAYSTRLPSTQNYSRCGLPLTLSCGHGVCYHCVVSKRNLKKNFNTISHKPSPDHTLICCKICQHVSVVHHEAVKNVLAVVNCYQMGLTLMEDLQIQIAGENIGFIDGNGGLFVPKTPEISIKRPQFVHPGDCAKHKMPLDYWCYEDEVALCKICRLTQHLNHDVIKIIEKNKEEVNEFYTAVDETVKMIGDMKETCTVIREKTGSVLSEYNTLMKQVRSHFSDLHSILALREQQVQQLLFQALQECTGPLKHVEKNLREAYYDISCELRNANTSVNSPETTRRGIVRCTESIRRFGFYDDAVRQTKDQLDPVSLSARMELVPDFAESLRHNEAVSVLVEGVENKARWSELQTRYDELKKQKNRSIVDAMNATSPTDPTEKKKARKQLFNELDVTPLVMSQAANQCQIGSEMTGLVVYLDGNRFYIQIHGPSTSEFDVLQAKIHLHEAKPVPRLHQLHPGQLVAGRFCGHWYRAIIESINLKCEDLVIFFIDYGNRELTGVKNVRLLTESLTSLPAQAVRCALTKNPSDLSSVFSSSPSQFVRIKVDRVEPGGVGQLDEPELTLWVTLIGEPAEDGIPSWMLPRRDTEEIEPLAFPVHKIRSTPTPPPAGANLNGNGFKRKMRFPDHKSPPIHAAMAAPPPYVLPKPVHQGQENRHRTKVLLVHLDSPGQFYVRVDSAQKNFHTLTQQLDSHFSGHTMGTRLDPSDVLPDAMCAVWLNHWNRCQIVRLDKNDVVRVRLIDIGQTISVDATQLFQLDQPRWLDDPPMALQCRLWGIRPAGHMTNWSGSSTDKMKDVVKLSSAFYLQVYCTQEEKAEDGTFQLIHYVRFYYEYLQPGGPLEFDQTLTGCLNDELFKNGLALRQSMAVTVQPSPKRWLPSIALPPELEAIPSWIDEDGHIYIQRIPGPTNHLELISQLLNWHYAKSTPTLADLEHWDKDEPCVARYSKDNNWCRAIVLSADDETKTASLVFVDYGNPEKLVAYDDMRKTLICYEYAIQATRCRMAKYPGNAAPSSEHLEILDDVLVNHRCQVRVEMKSGEPLIDIQLMSGQSHELDKVFELLQSEPSISSRVETPAPTIPLSSVDMDDSIFDDRSSEFSDEGSLDFHYDDMRAMEAGTYRTLSIPDRCFLPIRIVRLLEDTRAVIQPARYSSNDSPAVWQEQVDGFARLDIELQRSAPRLQDIEVVDHGSPCGCQYPVDGRWYRGIIKGFADDSLRSVRVELVDIDVTVNLPRCNIKQLPNKYLDLPRHSMVSRLIDYRVDPMFPPDLTLISHCMQMETPLRAYFKETSQPLQMTLFYKDSQAKFIPALELE